VTDRIAGKGAQVAERGYLLRFLVQLSAVFAFGALLLFATLFLFLSRPIQGDYSSVFFALRHLTEFALPMVSFSALVYVLLVCGAIAVVCVYAIHKVAGPIYRMERVIETYLAGNPFSRRGSTGSSTACGRTGGNGWGSWSARKNLDGRTRQPRRKRWGRSSRSSADRFPNIADLPVDLPARVLRRYPEIRWMG
jgi:hypothetical protein